MTKKKQTTLSTGSIVAIVLGILVLVFMILSFINHQIEQSRIQDSENIELYCDEGMVLGDDKMCHEECGEGYCEDKDICYYKQCHVYPSKAVACMDKIEDDLRDYNLGVNIVNRLSEKTCYEAWFKYNRTVQLVVSFADSSQDCLKEIEDKDFLLEELGYNMTTYIGRWDNITSDATYYVLEKKVSLEQDCG